MIQAKLSSGDVGLTGPKTQVPPSTRITGDIYGHLTPGSNRDMANRLDTQPAATHPQPAKQEEA